MRSTASDPHKIRLQLFLSRNGVCSRREAMELIQQGRVAVNGKIVTEPSTPVDPRQDTVNADGRRVEVKRFTYVLLNKPAGYTTTKEDVHAEKTVLDLLPESLSYLVPVGRLDKDTEGLLLLTNDGDVTYHLTHPRFEIIKVYEVSVQGVLDSKTRNKLERGIELEGRKTAAAKIRLVRQSEESSIWSVEIHEGRKRQVRLMFAKMGHKVLYLRRLSQGPLQLGDLPKGQWRHLNDEEVKAVRKLIKR